MPAAFVRGKRTGEATEANVVFAAEPAANNTLFAFIHKSTEPGVAPTVTDDKGDTWTVSATHAESNAGAGGLWFAYKAKAKGTEKEVKATGGTIQSDGYGEISGSSGVIDTITAFNNIATSTASTTGAYTNGVSKGLLLVGAGGNSGPLGALTAWTGTGPELTNVVTTTSRGAYGYLATTEKIEGKTFTLNHATTRPVGMLAVTFKEEAAAEEPPTVTTEAASPLTTTTAQLNGKANPNSHNVTDCKYEYGTTEGLGSTIAVEQTVGSGSAAVAVTAQLTGLTPNTTYYYRLSATNGGGTSKSTPIASLKTEAQPPEIELDPQVTEEAAGGTSPAPAMIL